MIQRFFTKGYTSIQSLAEYVGSAPNDVHLLNFLSNKGIKVLEGGRLSSVLDVKDWHNIWLSFTIYALIITVLFVIFFKHKHKVSIAISN